MKTLKKESLLRKRRRSFVTKEEFERTCAVHISEETFKQILQEFCRSGMDAVTFCGQCAYTVAEERKQQLRKMLP